MRTRTVLEGEIEQDLQQVRILGPIPQLLLKMGVDPREVLAAARLDQDALRDPEGPIPFRAMGLLVRAAVQSAAGVPWLKPNPAPRNASEEESAILTKASVMASVVLTDAKCKHRVVFAVA